VRRDKERLLDILEAVERIEKYAARGRVAFNEDELVQNWMVYHIAIIGEACRALPVDFQARFTNVPWADIIAMRNILIHHYFGIDLDAVWLVVERDIPELKANIERILLDIQDDEESAG
jgi:uncharacterized protein with HEPN domain